MHLHQAVDVLHTHPRAGGDALAARGIEQGRLAALLARHGGDDGFLAQEGLVIHARGIHGLFGLFRAGQHAHDAAEAAHFLHLAKLVGEVFQVELAFAHLLRHALGFFLVVILRRLFNERDNVALAENAARDALGVKSFDPVEFFADTEKLDRQAGHCAHGKRRAAAPVAIHPGEHQAGQRQAFMEALGGLYRVLPCQRVSHQQGLGRVGNGGDLGRLIHHLLVDGGPAGGIEDEHVMAAEFGGLNGAFCDVGGQLAGDNGQRGDAFAGLVSQDGELLHGRRAAHVEAGEEDFLLLLAGKAEGELARCCGLTRTLQAGHHDDRRRAVDLQRGVGVFPA